MSNPPLGVFFTILGMIPAIEAIPPYSFLYIWDWSPSIKEWF
jgi:hypothetical protein